MEKSMSEPVEPVQSFNRTMHFTTACGFALYWACFFTMLMRNSFMDGNIEVLWYHLFLRVVFLLGSGLVCVIAAFRADQLSSAKGVRIQRFGVVVFSVVAATASFAFHSLGQPMPLAVDLVAWSLAGAGLACLLLLWIELLGVFSPRQRTASLIAAVGLGAPAYLVMNLLPFPFNIGLLCLSPLISLGMLHLIDTDPMLVPAVFVPLKESRERARWRPSFMAIAVAYGAVFGLGIGSTTQLAGSETLYGGIAVMLLLGAFTAWLSIHFLSKRIERAGSFRLLFPVLIIALIPMSFLQGLPAVACNLLVLGCYVFFETVDLDLALTLAERQQASRTYLSATCQAFLYLGMAGGHIVGLIVTSSGIMDYATLSTAALALVVMLAIFVTFASVSPLVGKEESTAPVQAPEDESATVGHWKLQCDAVARQAGLSARETEVFMLLAKGRGVEHIQNKLCISSHTVKTHVYNIYRKMGIGSREELLDAVEAVRLSETDESSEPRSH